jgi:hypothetical protein
MATRLGHVLPLKTLPPSSTLQQSYSLFIAVGNQVANMLELRNSLYLSNTTMVTIFHLFSDKTLTQIQIYSSIHLGTHYAHEFFFLYSTDTQNSR